MEAALIIPRIGGVAEILRFFVPGLEDIYLTD